jgi:hypothetical protein
MRNDGFHIADENFLGVPADFRQRFHRQYFTTGILRRYPDDIPADRERARDVIRYDWAGEDKVSLVSHDSVAIAREGRLGPREFSRVELVEDEDFAIWTAGILSLVPPESRLERGTFGVNLFRTRTQVVTGQHRDHERFIIVYVLAKSGDGAETTLHDDLGEVVQRTTLRPGEFVIFDDERFKHSASPLTGAGARRDVLVCTVNYAGTYPL